jgi:hypothetical protein
MEQELETWQKHDWKKSQQQQQQADWQQHQAQQDQLQQQTEMQERGWQSFMEWQEVHGSRSSAAGSVAPPFDTVEEQDEASVWETDPINNLVINKSVRNSRSCYVFGF